MDDNMTYNEIAAAAEYSEARMHLNNDLHGQAENPLDFDYPLPDDDGDNFSDRYALAHPGALM